MSGKLLKRLASVSLAMTLSGCPGGAGGAGSQASSTGDSVDARWVLASNASDPGTQTTLAGIATATTRSVSLRYLALRKLEEAGAPGAVTVSEQLASASGVSKEETFLRDNAVAVLERSPKAEAKAALERVKNASFQAAIVAAEIEHGRAKK